MATFCELDEVVLQIRYKTQIFYETFKRDSIAEQLYNFSNDQESQDPDTPYSKSLERDYSNLIYSGPKNQNPPVSITVSPPPQLQKVNGGSSAITTNSSNTTTDNNTVSNNNISSTTTTTVSSTTSNVSSTTSNVSNISDQNQPPPQQQQTQQQQPNKQQTNDSKTCKVVTFSGTSVKLNKNLNNKPDQKSIQYNNNNEKITTTEKNGVVTIVTPTTTITSSSNAPVFVFVKEQIPTSSTSSSTQNQPQEQSLLSRLVKPAGNDSDDMFREYGEFTPIGDNRGILITCHSGIQSIGLIKVKVIESATVIQAVAAVLKQHFQTLKEQSNGSNSSSPSSSSSTLSPQSLSPSSNGSNNSNANISGSSISSTNGNNSNNSLIPDPKAYNLRIADSIDGKIDEDYPTLDINQMVYKFKSEILVLCLNPKYEGHKKRSSSGNNAGKTLQPFEKGHARRVSGSVGGSDSSLLVVKITLPDGSSTKVAYQPEMKLKELLLNTIKKRKLTGDHHFTLENGVTCNLNMSMDQLGSVDLVLASSGLPNFRRSMIIDPSLSPLFAGGSGNNGAGSGTTDDSSTTQNAEQQLTEIFWHDALAWQYKTYEVTKLKKYGSKQERVLGIDKERITNMSPKEQETKRPARLVKDVSKISLVDGKPKTFTIEYIDSKNYIYEAKSHALAIEIVGKVSYILGKK